MSAVDWEVRRLLSDPQIRTVVRGWISDARHDYVKRTAKAEREIERQFRDLTCHRCGAAYVRRQPNQRFCSYTCRKRHHDKEWRDYKRRWQRDQRARKRAEAVA